VSALFNIISAQGDYNIEIRSGLLKDVLNRSGHNIIIADAFFTGYLTEAGLPFLAVRAEESAKSLDAIPEIIVQLRKLGCNRHSCLIALGGGIIQDLVTFVASIYMRGIRWVYIPTTLLGMTDSCIGGKSSINVGEYKNIVGTYCPPVSIFLDPGLTETLSAEQRVAGLIEAAKICYCRSDGAFERYLSHNPYPAMPADKFEPIIVESLSAKKWFIEIDEFDKNERLLLNFGHTFGHALEGASHFRISHGVAVGVGILCAIAIAANLGISSGNNPSINLLKSHIEQLLEAVPNLASELNSLVIDDILERFIADKKHHTETYVLVGPTAKGGVTFIHLPKEAESLSLIQSTFSIVIESFCHEI
jgi:3-dehydroquinate synthase